MNQDVEFWMDQLAEAQARIAELEEELGLLKEQRADLRSEIADLESKAKDKDTLTWNRLRYFILGPIIIAMSFTLSQPLKTVQMIAGVSYILLGLKRMLK